jgi:hypothetical protein
MRELEARGAHIYIPRHDQDYAIGVGLRMLTLRHAVIEEDGLFRPDPAQWICSPTTPARSPTSAQPASSGFRL